MNVSEKSEEQLFGDFSEKTLILHFVVFVWHGPCGIGLATPGGTWEGVVVRAGVLIRKYVRSIRSVSFARPNQSPQSSLRWNKPNRSRGC